MKKALIFAAAMVLNAGCMREASQQPSSCMDGSATYRISACMAAEDNPRTKGNIAYDSGAGDNFCWMILQGNELLYYGTGEVDGVVLSSNANYNVLAWANATGGKGGLDLSMDNALESIRDNGGIDGLLSTVYRFGCTRSDWNGLRIPASYHAAGITPASLDSLDGNTDGVIRFPLRRLTARLNLTIAYDDMVRTMFPRESVSGVEYGVKVNSIKLGGMSQSVGLFSDSHNIRHSSSSTVDQSSGEQAYSFFIPESLGGNLLGANTSPLHKDASALAAAGADPESYPYVEASITMSAYMVSSAFTKTFRFYIGGNSTSNFDIFRNREYNITLLLSYDGLDVTDTWKLDGETSALGNRECAIIACNKPRAAAGEKVVLTARYEYGGEGNAAADFYLKQNGFALCTGSDRTAYLNTGAIPSGFAQLHDEDFILECRECHHYYTGMPAAAGSARLDWLEENLVCHGDEISCRWCGSRLFSKGDGSGDWQQFSTSSGTYSAALTNCLGQYGCDFEYTIPAGASVGDVFRIYAVTRDGRAGNHIDITVSDEFGLPTLAAPSGDELWVAQKAVVTASGWAEGIFGENPDFSFGISCLDSDGLADSAVAGISAIDSRSVYVSAKKPGTYTVTCSSGGRVLCSSSGTVSAPVIGYPVFGTVGSLTVRNNGASTSLSAPGYIVPDPATGEWVEYDSYDGDLFAECLGTPVGTMVDNNGWVAMDGDGVFLKHAYKNGIVSPSNLVPYKSPGTRLDLLRFTSPKLPDAGQLDIPVYFDVRYSNLDCIMDYGVYNKYSAENYTPPAQPSLQFNVQSYWIWGAFPKEEFISEVNGQAGNEVSVIMPRGTGTGNYMFNTSMTGRKRFYWRLKGREADSFELTLCSITCRLNYIGNITCSCDPDDNTTRRSIYGGFVRWLDSPVGAFETPGDSEIDPGILQGFRVYVGCDHIPPGLFRINHKAVLPTEGTYNPNPVSNTFGWTYYQNSRSAVYYSQAKHFYDDESLSYTAAMARWASHYVTLILATIETHGFGMDMYKSYNAPLFAPALSPATVDGLTWIKTSDNGTTAVWDSSDGLQTCTFTYGTW